MLLYNYCQIYTFITRLFIMENSGIKEFNDESIKNIAKEIVVRRLAVIIHSLAYFFVNISLVIINLLTNQNYFWALWVLISWIIGLALHIFNFVIFKFGLFSKRGQRGFSYHFFIFIIINGYLFFVNYYTTYTWIWWWIPALFWGIGILIHFILYRFYKPSGKDFNPKKSWLDRMIDKEMNKLSDR